MVAGHPIGIKCCEGRWVSFGESEAVGYRYVTCAEELEKTMEFVRCHLTDLRKMLCGLEAAKHRLDRYVITEKYLPQRKAETLGEVIRSVHIQNGE